MARSIDLLPDIVEAAGQGSVKGAPGPEFGKPRKAGRTTTVVPFHPAVGRTVRGMGAALEAISDGLGAHLVTVEERGKGQGALIVMWEDPWPSSIRWHWPADPWDGFAVATTTDGRPITTTPVGAHWLLGGMTRSGKTSMLHTLAAGAAVSRGGHVMVGFDLKGTELKGWRPRLSALATSGADAVRLLRAVEAHAKATMARMAELGIREVHRADEAQGLHTVGVFVDETRALIEDPQHGAEALELLSRLAYLYTSAGVSVVCAIQRPMASEIGSLRANLVRRACFAVEQPGQTAAVLGHQDVDAHRLPVRQGLAYLDVEGERGCPLVKAHYMADVDIATLAEATSIARPDVELGADIERAGTANPVVLPEPEPASKPASKRRKARRVKAPDGCPVAQRDGMVYVHRLRAWEERGDTPSCDGCGCEIEWSAAKVDPDMDREVVVVCEECSKTRAVAA